MSQTSTAYILIPFLIDLWHDFVYELRERVAIFSEPYITFSRGGKRPILLHMVFEESILSHKIGGEHVVVLSPMLTLDQPEILSKKEERLLRAPAIYIPQLDSFVQNEMWSGKIDAQKEDRMSNEEVRWTTIPLRMTRMD